MWYPETIPRNQVAVAVGSVPIYDQDHPPQIDPQLGIFHLHLLQGSTLQGSADQRRGRGAGQSSHCHELGLGTPVPVLYRVEHTSAGHLCPLCPPYGAPVLRCVLACSVFSP